MSKLFKIFSSLVVFVCVFTLIGLNASKAMAYDNSTFSGPWIGCDINDLYPDDIPCHYMLPDGRGTITDMGVFLTPGIVMTYNVSGNGRLEVSMHGTGHGYGQLTSNTTGYADFFIDDSGRTLRSEIFKVRDAGAMQGTWRGQLGSYDVVFNVDTNGVVQSFTGMQGPVTGRLFKEGDIAAGFFRTGESRKFNQVGINGFLNGNELSGKFKTDSNDAPESFTLTRVGGPSPAPEITDSEKADIIFNWLEYLVPEILESTSQQQTHELSGILYRYYPANNVYIATFHNHLFFIDRLGNVHDLGEVDFWLPIAQAG